MRLLALAATALLALGTAAPAFADCPSPKEPPAFTDTAAATDADMLAAQHAVKEYLAAMEERLKCLGENSSSHNSAVDQMQKVAGQFNASIRAYRSKHS
jgi:hypothetical protein